MTRRHWTTLAATVLLLAACGGADPSGAPASESTAAPPSEPAATTAASDGAAAGPCSPTTGAATVTVEIRQFAYIPGRVEAAVGDVITFSNADAAPHTATLDDESCSTENLGQGASGSLTFSQAGEYPFFCRVHPDMTGVFVISG